MGEYPQPGGEQRSQQKFVIFDRFERLNTQAARVGLPDNQLAWLENLQPLAENRLLVVPAPAAAAVAALPETIVLQFYATMNNEDWIILFTTAGAGFFYNVTTNAVGQFAPDGTFSLAPDCTTWQASRVLIYDTVASYCTFDGTIFVRGGMLSPNINVTAPGQGYTTAPPVALLVNGSGGVAVSVLSPGSFTAPGAGQLALNIPAPPAGGIQATGFATVVGTSPFSVQSVTITNPGSGYTTPFPVITLAAAVTGTAPIFSGFLSANGATAASTINSSGQVVSVFLTNPGSGFAAGDGITVVIGTSAGGGATFATTMSGAGVAAVQITNNSITLGATSNTFALVIDPPPAGGTQATGVYTTVFLGAGTGAITSATITNPGSGYISVPRIRPNPAGGIGPQSFQAIMQPQRVLTVSVVSGGAGFPPSTTLPLIFSGGPGITPATGTVTTNAGGVIISVALLSGGNYPFGSTPVAMVGGGASGGGSGATAAARVWPFVQTNLTTATLAVFQGRVFLGSGQLLQWTGTGASPGFGNNGFDDFLLADNAGATLINDADLVHDITALRSFNNYLWVVGDESIKQIGTLFPSGAPPFQLLTLSSDQGTKWPKSCISFNRIFLFANRSGIFGVFGSTVQKISDDLDGIFQHVIFADGIQGAVVDLNSKHSAIFLVHYNDPVAGLRSLLLGFDGKRWWLGNQGNNLATIVTVPTFTPLLNELWGSVTGTDVTQLLADPATAQPFKLSTALSHNTNPVQGKRLIRAGFTADAAASAAVNALLEADTANLARQLVVTPTSLLVGGANDANNAPISISGVYLGVTLTATLANFTLHNVILEYQETSLWKGAQSPTLPPPTILVAPIISSAGVFDASGNLVRTIWSAQADDPRATNLQPAVWDGTLDDGSVAATGDYTIQMLEHNISYAWEGAVGNSSPDHSTSVTPTATSVPVLNYYHSYGGNIFDMAITPGGEIYFTTGYDERLHTFHVTTESNPQRVNTVLGQAFRDALIAQHYCCTDGINVYFDWEQTNKSFVWAINCATKLITVFSSFDEHTPNTPSGYDLYTIGTATDSGDGSSFIYDLAVQRSGNILFIARAALNTIYTLNKTTGAALHSFTGFTHPTRMDTNPVTGDLWVTHVVSASAAPSWDADTATAGIVLSNSNLTALSSTGVNYAYSTGSTAAKSYFEVVQNNNGGVPHQLNFGITSNTFGRATTGFLGFNDASTSLGYYGQGELWINSVLVANPPSYGQGDNVGFAVDIANHLIWVRVNGGQWNGSPTANPATGTGGISTGAIPSPIFAALGCNAAGVQATANFASSSWAFAAPAGFSQVPGVLRTTTVSKMSVDGLGNLTDTGVAITGATRALDVAISPDGTTVLVADGGSSQQVRAFNTADGSVMSAWGISGTLGVAGGYATGPAVTNTKFMFNHFLGAGGGGLSTFLTYSSNGSFWLGDPGNCRNLHFSAGNSPTYIEQISYLPLFYSTWVCFNDETRVFGSYLEFKIDYSKPLLPGNGSWTLANNWFFGAGIFSNFGAMRYTITGTNGRTYVPRDGVIFEMTATGYRNTGVSVNYDYIDRDFNLWGIANTDPGAAAVFKVNRFAGFDSSNNPMWTTNPVNPPSTVSLTTPVFPPLFPSLGNPTGENNTSNYVEALANGIIPVFDIHANTGGAPSPQYHFGGIDAATGAFKFAAHPPIPLNNGGENSFLIFPPAPAFGVATNSIGNSGVTDGGGGFQAYVPGTADVFTLYRGESWGSNQTSVWSHWHQSGLLINRTGVAAPYFGQFSSTFTPPAVRLDNIDAIDANPLGLGSTLPNVTYSWMGAPGLSGNSFQGGIALQNNSYYLYNNDEWYHGGIARWRISNLDKIRFSSVPVHWNSAMFVPPPALTAADFLAGLPFNTANLSSGAGNWVRNPTTDSGSNTFSVPLFRMYTNAINCDRHVAHDLAFEANLLGSTATASYSWTRTGGGPWTLSGIFTQANIGQGSAGVPSFTIYIDILDNTGKKLVRMHNMFDGGGVGFPSGATFWVNNIPIRTPLTRFDVWLAWIKQLQPLTVSADVVAGTMMVSYAGYTMTGVLPFDVGADITHPAQFRLTYQSAPATSTYLGLVFTALGFDESGEGMIILTAESGTRLMSEDGKLLTPG